MNNIEWQKNRTQVDENRKAAHTHTQIQKENKYVCEKLLVEISTKRSSRSKFIYKYMGIMP